MRYECKFVREKRNISNDFFLKQNLKMMHCKWDMNEKNSKYYVVKKICMSI